MTRAPCRRAHAARRRSLAPTRSFRTDVSCPRTPVSSLDLVRGGPPSKKLSSLSLCEQSKQDAARTFVYIDKLRMSYGPAWPNLKQAVKGMKEIIELAKAGQLPPLDEPED